MLVVLTSVILSRVIERLLGVRLTRRHEGGFFRRNADNIMLLLGGAVVGAIATKLVDWLK